MMFLKLKTKSVVIVAILCGAIFLFPAASDALTIISPVVELAAEPGETQRGIVKLYNETDKTLQLQASVIPYGQAAGQGSEFTAWIVLDQTEVVVMPSQVVVVPFSVQVPQSAEPGGYYATIAWSEAAVDGQVAVQGNVGTVVLLKIGGDTSAKLVLDRFTAAPDMFGLPVEFSAVLSNQGSVHVVPYGTIEITNWFGGKKILPLNGEKSVVMPGTQRQLSVLWSGETSGNFFKDLWNSAVHELTQGAIGPHHATVNVFFGNETVLSSSVSFVVIPFHLIVLCIVAVVAAAVWYTIERKIKKLKQPRS